MDDWLRVLLFALGLVWLAIPMWAVWDMWRNPSLRFDERYLAVVLFFILGIGILVRAVS